VPDASEDSAPERDDSADTSPRSERRRPRWGLRILGVLLGLALLGVALVAAFALFLNQKVENNVKREALLPTPAASAVAGTPAPGEPTPTPDPSEAAVNAEIANSKGLNVLIIGSDARPGEKASRSDVMVLAHIPEDKSKVYLVHFPRDLWVSIPGRGQAKLNAAYAYGGAPLLVQTLQNLIHVRVDHVAKTDFEGFRSMTNAVGGVRVYAEEGSDGIRQGWNDLNGTQALDFVRERKSLSKGDISRGKRQQAFIKALMMKAISPDVITNPFKVAQFTEAATSNLVVDEGMTTGFMRDQAFALRGIRSEDVVFITAPFTGYGWSADGQSIDVVDQPGMEALGTAIRQDRLADHGRASIIP
jgi:LCP family protein required for cell wall assembly